MSRPTDHEGRFAAVVSGYTLSAGECGVKDQVSCAQPLTFENY